MEKRSDEKEGRKQRHKGEESQLSPFCLLLPLQSDGDCQDNDLQGMQLKPI